MNEYDAAAHDPDAVAPVHPDHADHCRLRLIEVAQKMFAESGYDGASVRAITQSANANLGAINYHFGSKEMLYMAVLMKLVGPLAPRIRFAATAKIPALDRVENIVRAIFTHIRGNPDMPAIMVRELASGREIAAPVKKTFGEALPALAGVITEGQADGTIRPGDPVLLALSTVAQPVYLNLARPVIAAVAGVDPLDARVVEHAVTVVRAALENRP